MVFEDLQHIIPEAVKQAPRTKSYVILAGVVTVLAVACLALAIVVGVRHGAVSPGCVTPACLRVASRMRQDMNPSVDPCDNFYLYSLNRLKYCFIDLCDDANALGSSFYVIVLYDLYLKHEERLREIVEAPARRTSQRSAERKMKTFFKLCAHDYGRMKDAGRTLVDIIRNRLKGCRHACPLSTCPVGRTGTCWTRSGVVGNWSWQEAVIRLQSDYLTDVLFALRIGRSRDDTPQARIRITSGRLGMSFRNYHDADKSATTTTTAGEIARNFTQFNWLFTLRTFFDQVDIRPSTEVEMSQAAYFVRVNAMLRNESQHTARIMNNYIVWRLIDTYSRQLSTEYKFAKLKFSQSQYGSTEFHSTWKYCLTYTQFHFTAELALQLLRAHLGTANHTQVMNLMTAVKTTLLNRIDDFAWMDDVTKKRAKQTLNISQSETYLTNLVRVNRFKRHMANMALSVSLKYYQWMSSLQGLAFSVHPHFIYQYNEVYVPPGTLQFPIYELTFRWVNGTYGDWWTPETTEEYDKRAACFRDYYSTLKAGPYLVDGIKHTVEVSGEYDYTHAVSRVAGLRLAYMTYKRWKTDHGDRQTPAGLDMTSDQAFFVAAAQMTEFRDAFKCGKETKMAATTQCDVF
ncbi:hypothetical protein NP493_8g07007 [Ridgeia piscesae]|uniref:Peptidase family M13 n=1 Tax=Ridgeia piscesae TaxID=27915 RepID=A0AAD9PF94_RIDPI|nr:hypothetical protein NP493_8g07007 [Ridgeia piscesae]